MALKFRQADAVHRIVAQLFVVAVLAFLAFAGFVMAGVVGLLRRGDPGGGHGGSLTLGPWQLWAFVGWLVICATVVLGGGFIERRRRARRRGR
jgi:hypothetical protein